jgi:hypothetical protein
MQKINADPKLNKFPLHLGMRVAKESEGKLKFIFNPKLNFQVTCRNKKQNYQKPCVASRGGHFKTENRIRTRTEPE